MSEVVSVRLPPDLLRALAKFMADHQEMTRAEAVRYILRDWFVGQALIRFEEGPEGAN